jgi:hypothetical protein
MRDLPAPSRASDLHGMRSTERPKVRATAPALVRFRDGLRSIFCPNGPIGEDGTIDGRFRFAGLFRSRPSRSIAVRDGFSGEIKGLNQLPEPVFDAFLLASGARILYPVVCFACESGIVNQSKVGQAET